MTPAVLSVLARLSFFSNVADALYQLDSLDEKGFLTFHTFFSSGRGHLHHGTLMSPVVLGHL